MSEHSLFAELKKRRVIQVATIYGVVAWGVTEIIVTVTDRLFLPSWIATLAVIAFVVGFPIAMFLSWTFDITADGIQRTTVRSRRGKVSIAGAISLLVVFTAVLFALIRPSNVDDFGSGTTANSIAVLPFQNVSSTTTDDYIVSGLSDELRDQLGRVAGIRIAARSSSIAAHEQSPDARSISSSLGVAKLVEGSVRRRGDRIRISVQVIEGSSGLALWSKSYDPGPEDLLAVQQSMAEEIISVVLPEFDDVAVAQTTRSNAANELMLLARYYERQVRAEEEVNESLLQESIRLYRQAIEADPDSALAHARLAGVLMYNGDFGAAEAPMFQALSHDPENSEVQNTLGQFYWGRGIKGAGIAFRRAAELNPNNADALSDFAYWTWQQGYQEEPHPLFIKALELDPLSLTRFGALGDYYGHSNMVPELLDLVQRIESTFDDAAAYRLIARLMELAGSLDESIAWTIKARNLEPENPEHVEYLAELYAEIGDADTALALEPDPGVGLLYKLRRYEELIDKGEFLMIDEPSDLKLRYVLAFSYVVTDQAELAVHTLRRTGLPDTVLGEARQAADMEAYVSLIEALDAIGESTLAKDLAAWWENRTHAENDNWWVLIYRACPLAVSGFDDRALEMLSRVGDSARLPWDTLIRDMRCFQRYADEPIYQSMLEKVDRRRRALRLKLPDTLSAHGVTL